ncbi:hypothetical protein AtNW77_Chr3g0197041 [Arabidopsis thaliana]|uniref:Uncharacterized protein n=1 Tax=Arabidopsis thaliana x Arabidopsis arenosa TaxID=1240361 RepID=A0A8T2EUX6_9BRAS|nr:hypothetical protein ISN45_At03g036150 [Arabidopsis thaliana x Arabidopsis arenosa]
MERSCFKEFRVADILTIRFKLHPYLTLKGLIEMKRRGLIRDTTGYILNGGITFLTVSSRLMKAFRTHGVRFWLMEKQGGAQEYAVKAPIYVYLKYDYEYVCMMNVRLGRIELWAVVSLVMWTVMDRRVNSWSRTAYEPGMGVSEPRGPASTYEVLVVTRMTGPNDVYVYININKMIVMNLLLEVKAC